MLQGPGEFTAINAARGYRAIMALALFRTDGSCRFGLYITSCQKGLEPDAPRRRLGQVGRWPLRVAPLGHVDTRTGTLHFVNIAICVVIPTLYITDEWIDGVRTLLLVNMLTHAVPRSCTMPEQAGRGKL